MLSCLFDVPMARLQNDEGVLEAKGRPDSCVVPRAALCFGHVVMDALMVEDATSKLPPIPKGVLPPLATVVEDAATNNQGKMRKLTVTRFC